jgi:DNA invertase Pin-like site-specific DNA recombinase
VHCLGYVRVSTGEQHESGAGLAAQRAAILAEAHRRGWEPVEFIEDTASGKDAKRPGLERAREALKAGDAGALIVSKCDRLSRSLQDFLSIQQEAQAQGWVLLALDVPADMTTPHGEAMANVLMVFANLERKLIGQRTRDALAERKAAGVTLGRPRVLPNDVRDRIKREREKRRTLRAIAEALNADEVPTAHGGKKWHASTVRAVLGY